jgi:hypothetical protein
VSAESDSSTKRARESWRAHNLSQLLYFRSLSLREKLEAVEGMAEVVRLLERMRAAEKTKIPNAQGRTLDPT